MLKIGHLVVGTVVKALPDHESYLLVLAGTQVLAQLPKKYATQEYRQGDAVTAAVFEKTPSRTILSQKSPQFIRRVLEHVLSPLLLEGKIAIKRAASVSAARFFKVAVEGLTDEDPVKLCLPHLHKAKAYTTGTIVIVKYSRDMREYIVNALVPAPPDKVRTVIYLPGMEEATVLVDKSVVGLFLGKGGVNAAAASKLTGISVRVAASVLNAVPPPDLVAAA